jgi:hypothetical protein
LTTHDATPTTTAPTHDTTHTDHTTSPHGG